MVKVRVGLMVRRDYHTSCWIVEEAAGLALLDDDEGVAGDEEEERFVRLRAAGVIASSCRLPGCVLGGRSSKAS